MGRTTGAMALGTFLFVTSSAASADDWSMVIEAVVGEHSSEFSIYEESRPFIVFGAYGDDEEPRAPGWAEVGLATRYAFVKVKEDGSLDCESGNEQADGLLRYHLEYGIPGVKSLLRRSGLDDFQCKTEDMAINADRAPEWTSSASTQAASLVDTLWKAEGAAPDAFPGYLHDLLGGDVATFVSRFGKLEEVQERWAKHVAERISR